MYLHISDECAQSQIKNSKNAASLQAQFNILALWVIIFFFSLCAYHFICLDLKFHTLIIMRCTECQCEFKAWTKAWNSVVSRFRVPYNQGDDNMSSSVSQSEPGVGVQFKYCGIHPLRWHRTKCWHHIYGKEHLVGLMSLVRLVFTSPLSDIPLNTCSLRQMCFTGRICLPT